jgi:hypothetical protein
MPINALEYPSTRYKCFIVVGMKTLFILIVVGLMVVTARAAEIQGGMEIYTPAYFNSLIMKDKNHPSYDFWFDKAANRGRGLYVINVDYKSAPPAKDVVALMKDMISFVATNYPPREVLCMSFVKGEASHLVDGDSALFFDPANRRI